MDTENTNNKRLNEIYIPAIEYLLKKAENANSLEEFLAFKERYIGGDLDEDEKKLFMKVDPMLLFRGRVEKFYIFRQEIEEKISLEIGALQLLSELSDLRY